MYSYFSLKISVYNGLFSRNMVLMLCNLDCYVNLVICIVNPLFILSYGSHRITMQYFTRIYIDVNIKMYLFSTLSIFYIVNMFQKPWKYHVFLPYFLMSYHVYDGKYVYFNTYWSFFLKMNAGIWILGLSTK